MPAAPLPLDRSASAEQGAIRQPLRIFICDDDLDFAEELAEGLSTHGFEVKTRAGGAALIQALEDFRPDVLLLDIFMPPPNGFEIINSLRENQTLRMMPLILMSGTDTGLLDVATQFCTSHSIRVIATLQKPLGLTEVARLCKQTGSAYRRELAATAR
ncbi:MAG TPA: response regulator, partial [Devosia sp.]|nr:response regulator [Devosia sp.]